MRQWTGQCYSSGISRKFLLLNLLQHGAYHIFMNLPFKTNIKLKMGVNPKDHVKINSLRNLK